MAKKTGKQTAQNVQYTDVAVTYWIMHM